uniref:Uncharacterized protein n=1 Tax=Vitis vinifera TaxID=29760 RepID=A5BY69_VITVI|nr:hypothetical protein VITISV_010849 [Vitis vinifera]
MYIWRSRRVLLSHPAIGYPDVKCRRTECPPFPFDVRIPDVNIRGGKCAAAGCKSYPSGMLSGCPPMVYPDALSGYTPCMDSKELSSIFDLLW